MLGVWWAFTALSSWYLAYMVLLSGSVYAAVQRWRSAGAWLRRALPGLALGAAVALVLVLPFALPYAELARLGDLKQYHNAASYWSGFPEGFVVPNPMHPIWGSTFAAAFPYIANEFVERELWIGVVPVVLAVVAVRRRHPEARAFVLLALAFAVVSLGTGLRLGGDGVYLNVGPRWAGAYYRVMSWVSENASFYHGPYDQPPSGTIDVPMPGLLLYWFLPAFSSMRNLARFAIVTMFGLAVLAGLGASTLRWRGVVRAVGTVVLGLAFVADTYIPYPLSPVTPRPADLWLAAQPDARTLAEFPLAESLGGFNQYQTIAHGHPTIGASTTHVEPHFRAAIPRLARFPDPDALALLRDWRVGWVFVTAADYPPADWPAVQARLAATPDLRPRGELAGVLVYELIGAEGR
jgi:hypothetical protein